MEFGPYMAGGLTAGYTTEQGSGCMNIKQQPEKSVMQPLYLFGYGLSHSDFRIDNYKCDEAAETGK